MDEIRKRREKEDYFILFLRLINAPMLARDKIPNRTAIEDIGDPPGFFVGIM